jgi:hypothetical protein
VSFFLEFKVKLGSSVFICVTDNFCGGHCFLLGLVSKLCYFLRRKFSLKCIKTLGVASILFDKLIFNFLSTVQKIQTRLVEAIFKDCSQW